MQKPLKSTLLIIFLLSISFYASAVHLSKNGTGQVLIFPYYTVNNDFNTLISLTNTAPEPKAYRVRFREAANSREVFAFNLYLGANDVWTAALVKGDADFQFHTRLITYDKSCTDPELTTSSGIFSKNNYEGDNGDIYDGDLNRMHEGFIEIIEMGVLSGDSANAARIERNSSQPNNCQQLRDAWSASSANNYWYTNPNADLTQPTGGLTGSVTLINIAQGIAASQEPTAINNFSDTVLNFNPSDNSPNLSDGMTQAIIYDGQGNSQVTDWEHGYQAVSAVLTKKSFTNEYVLTDEIGAETDWIVTLPTRQFFIDSTLNDHSIMPPFSDDKCEYVYYEYYNRNMQVPEAPIIPRPGMPTQSPPKEYFFCYSSNVIHLEDKEINEDSELGIFSSNYLISLGRSSQPNEAKIPTGFALRNKLPKPATATTPATEATYFDTGWLMFDFNTNHDGSSVSQPLSPANTNIFGFPMIGFAIQKYKNSNLTDSVLANYTGIFNHIANHQTNIQKQEEPPMEISEDNHGQVLIYPYYTVNNGFNTLLSIGNKTSESKALKVRFLEGKNGRSCLDFNIYLSSNDMWTAALIPTQSTSANHEGENTVKIITNDTSCTDLPQMSSQGQEFLSYGYDPAADANPANGYDQLGLDLERCTEGYIEIIEMANIGKQSIVDGLYFYPDSSIPSDCNVIDQITNNDLEPPSGNIYGSASLINVQDGIDMSFNATAIKHFTNEPNFTTGHDILPNLASGTNVTTLMESKDGIIKTVWSSSVDAVSALFMQSQINNDYVIFSGIGAQTDWVNTYPTKRFYVDPFFVNNPPLAPFSHAISPVSGACEPWKFYSYDREQNFNGTGVSIPTPNNFNAQHCYSVNIAYVGEDKNEVDSSQSIFESQLLMDYIDSTTGFYSIYDIHSSEGSMQLSTNYQSWLEGTGENNEIHRIYGQPVLGFTAQKYVNGAINNGSTLANYAYLTKNKNKKDIEIRNNN